MVTLKDAAQFVKNNKLISRGLALSGNPLMQAGSVVADQLGYGKRKRGPRRKRLPPTSLAGMPRPVGRKRAKRGKHVMKGAGIFGDLGSGIGSVFGGLGSGLGSVAHGLFGGGARGHKRRAAVKKIIKV